MSRSKVLQLYKSLLKENKKFTNYNFRMYALEKTKTEFYRNKSVKDPEKLQKLIQEAEDNLEIVRRQVLIGQMYGEGHLIIESKDHMKKT